MYNIYKYIILISFLDYKYYKTSVGMYSFQIFFKYPYGYFRL